MIVGQSLLKKMISSPNYALRICLSHISDKAVIKYKDKWREYGDSWQEESPEYFLRRMEEEFYEFRQAVEHDGSVDEALEELCDMNIFAVMFVIRSWQEACKG